ncbi:MAG TPA: hypothetical protein VHM64_12110, partial [Candidatus Binatia bacterium]|nr:hypothetical protein [Candidatus Binatia bacterium]
SGKAATKSRFEVHRYRNISRKAQRKKKLRKLGVLATWREEYPNPRISRCDQFARSGQILSPPRLRGDISDYCPVFPLDVEELGTVPYRPYNFAVKNLGRSPSQF